MVENFKKLMRLVCPVQLFRSEFKKFQESTLRYEKLDAQLVLRRAFTRNSTASIIWAHKQQIRKSPHKKTQVTSKLFPAVNDTDINNAVAEISEHGFYLLPERLPNDWVDEVVRNLNGLEVSGLGNPNDVQLSGMIFPREATYRFLEQTKLLEIPQLRNLVEDKVVREIIGRYLGCRPVFDFATAWWSFPSVRPDRKAAQEYHFDMDRVRWLKVFVYLTDVLPANGPHKFIRGSHVRNLVDPPSVRRYSDSEILTKFDRSDEVEFCGPAGTIFIEDTIGFHKGEKLIDGNRLVFEYEYSINHFGYPHPISELD